MNINLDKLDDITQTKYKEFKEKVEKLLATYQETDTKRFDLVKRKLEQTNGNWDTAIDLVSGNAIESVDISQLLAYEYCLATEKITKGKVSFEAMLDKLFDGVKKFRIGNPVPGMDDECLYGKGFDDPTAIPVTSKLYRMVMNAGAQHLDYFKDGNFTSAVFIFERGEIKGFAKDENGNPVDMKIDGIDFNNLNEGPSLLTNLRHTAFHEWTHYAEKETIEPTEDTIEYEFQSEDGKTYRNYEKVNSYVTSENIESIQEPQYIVNSKKVDSNGKIIKEENGQVEAFFQDVNGDIKSRDEVSFGLTLKPLDKEYCFSSGLTTREVLSNGETIMHNIVTEGFVEATARALVRAIDENVQDIDEGRYFEQVEMAKRVIESRDVSLGEDGQGQTYADFLIHSSVLKRDLESRTVELDDGSKVDGLHYISDYADKAKAKQTDRWNFFSDKNMMKICNYLGLRNPKEQIEPIGLTESLQLTDAQITELKNILLSGTNPDENFVNGKIAEFIDIIQRERNHFDSISEKLNYTDRTIDGQVSTIEIVQESTEDTPDLTVLDEIEQVKARQQRNLIERREEYDNSQNK